MSRLRLTQLALQAQLISTDRHDWHPTSTGEPGLQAHINTRRSPLTGAG